MLFQAIHLVVCGVVTLLDHRVLPADSTAFQVWNGASTRPCGRPHLPAALSLANHAERGDQINHPAPLSDKVIDAVVCMGRKRHIGQTDVARDPWAARKSRRNAPLPRPKCPGQCSLRLDVRAFLEHPHDRARGESKCTEDISGAMLKCGYRGQEISSLA